MKYENIVEGKFINRPNRFIAYVEVADRMETVHVKNTGRCRELLLPGNTVGIQRSDNEARKTKYDLISVYKKGSGWVNIDSQAPNKVVGEWLEKQEYDYVKPEYVYGNMKEYIEAVVLKKTIIEDEKEDIIDLLRRTLEESDLCANIIRLENFEIEKLADCLEQEIQNKRDKVGVVWNTLLEQNKIGISWENTMLYWKYYSISNYLKKFIEVNVDKLSVEKNNYVTDNFAKDIINAKFEDSVLKKLLPVLPMKTFDLDVEQLPENILAIMVECNYFGYTIEYYDVGVKSFSIVP